MIIVKKEFDIGHLKYSTLLREVEDMKKKLSKIETNLKYYSDVHPTKRELTRMKQFLKDLKAKRTAAFTPLEELRRK